MSPSWRSRLGRKCAVESNSTLPSGHQNQVFQGFSCVGYVHLSVLEIWLLSAHWNAVLALAWLIARPALCCCCRYAAGAEQSPGTAGFRAQSHVITGNLLVGRQSPPQCSWLKVSCSHMTTAGTGPCAHWLEPNGMQLVGQVGGRPLHGGVWPGGTQMLQAFW